MAAIPCYGKRGHSLIKAKMAQTGALLAGEMSGHVFFKERWFGFDDALYTGGPVARNSEPRG
jgi:phosphomannomutase/phosphoglucomutase